MKWNITVAVLLMELTGCSPSAKIVRERNLTATEVLTHVRLRNERIHTLQGGGTITVETPEASNSGSFDMNLKKPDSLRVELSGPFGIHFGTLFLSREKFLFYNWMSNKAIVGVPDGTTLNSLFRLRMQFDEVLRAFTGEFPEPAVSDSMEAFAVEQGYYVLRYRVRDEVQEYRIDGDAFIVSSYRVLDADGIPKLTAFALQADEADGIAMPHLVRVVFPKEHRGVTIAYDDIRLNEPVACSFNLPKRAEVIYR